MDFQKSVHPLKLKKLQEMAQVKYHRCLKRYGLALSEWQECQKPYSIDDNLRQYEVSSRILSEELQKQLELVRDLQERLEKVLTTMETLKKNPEQITMLHAEEIEMARERMEEAHRELMVAEKRCEELENYFDPG